MSILVAKGITKLFGGLSAVNNVDFCMEKGSITSVIGPNGAGKTTFFNIISGFYKPDAGKILFDGKDITGFSPDKIAKKNISRTFQNIRLFKEMLAVENVMIGMHLRLHTSLFNIVFRTKKSVAEEVNAYNEAINLLKYVGLSGKEFERAKNLSYGDQRRLEIARALASHPKLLMLDEPAAGLNPRETEEMTLLIRRINSEKDCSILLIEHDMKLVMKISEMIFVLNYGEKIAEGTPSEIRTNPLVINAYLGDEEETNNSVA